MKLILVFSLFMLFFNELRAGEGTPSSEINFSDNIDHESISRLIERIEREIERNKDKGVEITLILQSVGGDINHALRAVKFVREVNKNSTVTINTKVKSRMTCESACTIIFTAGEKRIASSKARFGFHSPKVIKGDLGKYTKKEVEDIYRKIWLQSIAEVDPHASHFIEVNQYLLNARMRYLSGKDLSTGYVTDII